MELQPLKQWICDTCGEIIEAPHDGWLEWVTDTGIPNRLRARMAAGHSNNW